MGQTESVISAEHEDKNVVPDLSSPSTNSQPSRQSTKDSGTIGSNADSSRNSTHMDSESKVRFSESKQRTEKRNIRYNPNNYGPGSCIQDDSSDHSHLQLQEPQSHWLDRLLRRDDEDSINVPSFTYVVDANASDGSKDNANHTSIVSNGSKNRPLAIFSRRKRRVKKEEIESIFGKSFVAQEYDLAGIEDATTKYVIRSAEDIQLVLSQRLRKKGLRDECLDPHVVCGRQIYMLRSLDSKELDIKKIDRLLQLDEKETNRGRLNRASFKKGKKSKPLRGDRIRRMKSQTIASTLFTDDAVLQTTVNPVNDIICINKEHEIYVCDVGLSFSQCQSIVDAAERCSQGIYSSYTYAKQTLGCRDHDALGIACESVTMKVYSTIREHIDSKNLDTDSSKVNEKTRSLVLDQREPHVVKYDTTRKDRSKLEMHTDKSEWTFIIALSQGEGCDYDAGGTYFECIDSTVHMERGHVIIFPGKLRHRGQKIVGGARFLLVGFLVERKQESGAAVKDSNASVSATKASVSSS